MADQIDLSGEFLVRRAAQEKLAQATQVDRLGSFAASETEGLLRQESQQAAAEGRPAEVSIGLSDTGPPSLGAGGGDQERDRIGKSVV